MTAPSAVNERRLSSRVKEAHSTDIIIDNVQNITNIQGAAQKTHPTKRRSSFLNRKLNILFFVPD